MIGKDCANVTVMTPTPYDQYGPQKCKPFLGGNEPMLTDFARIVRELAAKKGLKTVELHRTMTELLKAHPEAGLVGGDRVHPTDVGQYLMACLCLVETGADSIVEQTTVDAAGRETFDFDYAPKALPLPVTDLYKAIEKVWPVTERLNREMLTVKNLPTGRYALKADGREIGRYSAAELAAGVNLALLDTPNARRAARAEHLRAASSDRLRLPIGHLSCPMDGRCQGLAHRQGRAGEILRRAAREGEVVFLGRLAPPLRRSA